MNAGTHLTRTPTGDPRVVEDLLRDLPEWFGIEDAIQGYIARAEHSETYTAHEDGQPVGVLVLRSHGEATVEMDVLAVRRSHHRQGVGRDLVEAAERDLHERGVRYLQVKTLGPSDPSSEYALTRRFYLAIGYLPIEEFATDTVWEGSPCLLLVKHLSCQAPELPVTLAGASLPEA